jgi:hypothetical protein
MRQRYGNSQNSLCIDRQTNFTNLVFETLWKETMVQDDTILMFGIFLVFLADIYPPKPIRILPMPMVNLKNIFVGVVHAILSIAYLEKQSKE